MTCISSLMGCHRPSGMIGQSGYRCLARPLDLLLDNNFAAGSSCQVLTLHLQPDPQSHYGIAPAEDCSVWGLPGNSRDDPLSAVLQLKGAFSALCPLKKSDACPAWVMCRQISMTDSECELYMCSTQHSSRCLHWSRRSGQTLCRLCPCCEDNVDRAFLMC